MNKNRREFLKNTALAAAGIALTDLSFGLISCNTIRSNQIRQNFGLQLYTLRDLMPKDPVGTLKQVASFGYKQIESYEHSELGIYWGMKNTEFKKLMDDLGMKIVSSHCDINQNFEKKAAEAAEIGMAYLLSPYIGRQKSLDDYKRFAEVFNQRGEVCRRNGIKFGYHNHEYTFQPVDGQFPQDILMQHTDNDLVDYEMDIYWVVTAGQDPVHWLNKYPNRFRLSHVKDRQRNVAASNTDASVVVGTGQIDYPSILKVAREKGMRYFIVEQEKYENSTPIEDTRKNAEYMKTLNI